MTQPTAPDPNRLDPDADLKADLATLGMSVDDLPVEEPPCRPRPEGPPTTWVELPPGTTIDIMAMLNDA